MPTNKADRMSVRIDGELKARVQQAAKRLMPQAAGAMAKYGRQVLEDDAWWWDTSPYTCDAALHGVIIAREGDFTYAADERISLFETLPGVETSGRIVPERFAAPR